MKEDISTMLGDTKFNFRVACFFEYKDKMLLHRNVKVDNFWNLVGGRVKCGETTKEALIRELEEELGYKFEPERLQLFQINEMFFVYDNINCHELNFMYHIKLTDDDELAHKQDFGSCDKDNIVYHWFDKTEVANKNIKCLPDTIYHLAKCDKFDTIRWSMERKVNEWFLHSQF